MSTRKPEHTARRERKRPYRPPRLVRYGTLVELTRSSPVKVGPKDGLPPPGFFKSN